MFLFFIYVFLFLIIFYYVVFAPRRSNPEESTTFPESLDDLVITSFNSIPAQITIPAQFLMERREANGIYSNCVYWTATKFAQNKTTLKNYPTSFLNGVIAEWGTKKIERCKISKPF